VNENPEAKTGVLDFIKRRLGLRVVHARRAGDLLIAAKAQLAHGVAVHYIQPGKPDQNAYIERSNRSYRTDPNAAYPSDSLPSPLRGGPPEDTKRNCFSRPSHGPDGPHGPAASPRGPRSPCTDDAGLTWALRRLRACRSAFRLFTCTWYAFASQRGPRHIAQECCRMPSVRLRFCRS
jgi:hypothetical protein